MYVGSVDQEIENGRSHMHIPGEGKNVRHQMNEHPYFLATSHHPLKSLSSHQLHNRFILSLSHEMQSKEGAIAVCKYLMVLLHVRFVHRGKSRH